MAFFGKSWLAGGLLLTMVSVAVDPAWASGTEDARGGRPADEPTSAEQPSKGEVGQSDVSPPPAGDDRADQAPPPDPAGDDRADQAPPPDRQRDTPEEMTPTARKAKLHHRHQVGVAIGFGWGYRFIKPYGDVWCGEREEGDNAAYCMSAAPAFFDIGLSFGLTRHFDVIADFRYGLTKDDLSDRRPLVLMAGVRLWLDPDAAFKFALGLQLMLDLTKQDSEEQRRVDYGSPEWDDYDVGGRVYGQIQFDLLRYVGFYLRFSGVVGALRWLRLELEGSAGVQARFP